MTDQRYVLRLACANRPGIVVLARALGWAVQDRIFVNGLKTVVFKD